MGYPFREPIYWTPRGYKYVYVRGYYWKRLPNPYAVRTYRKPIKVSTARKSGAAPASPIWDLADTRRAGITTERPGNA